MTEHTYNNGDKVKDFKSGWEQPYKRAVVTNTFKDRTEIMLLEGNNKGETVERNNENIAPLKQKTFLCMIGMSYGQSQDKATAVRNCLEAMSISEDREEPFHAWIAEVDKTNWDIRGMGSVHSTFIDNEEEFEIDPELAQEISERAEDSKSLTHSAMDGAEPYREGLNYKAVKNTTGW